MYAFTKLSTGHLVKVYDRADDWQVMVYDPAGTLHQERWFSQWQADRAGSLRNAFEATCERLNLPFDGEVLRA